MLKNNKKFILFSAVQSWEGRDGGGRDEVGGRLQDEQCWALFFTTSTQRFIRWILWNSRPENTSLTPSSKSTRKVKICFRRFSKIFTIRGFSERAMVRQMICKERPSTWLEMWFFTHITLARFQTLSMNILQKLLTSQTSMKIKVREGWLKKSMEFSGPPPSPKLLGKIKNIVCRRVAFNRF